MQSDKYKRKVIEELTNELRELMDAPKKGNAKGKVKSMQRVYQESKEMFKKVEACSEHVHGREDEVRQTCLDKKHIVETIYGFLKMGHNPTSHPLNRWAIMIMYHA